MIPRKLNFSQVLIFAFSPSSKDFDTTDCLWTTEILTLLFAWLFHNLSLDLTSIESSPFLHVAPNTLCQVGWMPVSSITVEVLFILISSKLVALPGPEQVLNDHFLMNEYVDHSINHLTVNQ